MPCLQAALPSKHLDERKSLGSSHSLGQLAGPQSMPALRAEIASVGAACFLRLGLTLTGSSRGTELSEGIKAPARHPHALEKLHTQFSHAGISRSPASGHG